MYGRSINVLFEECVVMPNAGELAVLLRKAAEYAGATFLDECGTEFEPQGSTAVIVLAESHYGAHTWPENQSVAAVFYTCGEVDSMPAAKFVAWKIGAKKMTGGIWNYDLKRNENDFCFSEDDIKEQFKRGELWQDP